jgi:hypothetical protein
MGRSNRPAPRRRSAGDGLAALIRSIPPRQLLSRQDADHFRKNEAAAITAVLSGVANDDALAQVECTAMTQVLLFRAAVEQPGTHGLDAESCATALRELTATVAPVIATLRERARATGAVLCIGKEERDALGILGDVAGLSISMLPRLMHLLAMRSWLRHGGVIHVNECGE